MAIIRPHSADHPAGTYCGVTIHWNTDVPDAERWRIAHALAQHAKELVDGKVEIVEEVGKS